MVVRSLCGTDHIIIIDEHTNLGATCSTIHWILSLDTPHTWDSIMHKEVVISRDVHFFSSGSSLEESHSLCFHVDLFFTHCIDIDMFFDRVHFFYPI
jgi:hypothetical protein